MEFRKDTVNFVLENEILGYIVEPMLTREVDMHFGKVERVQIPHNKIILREFSIARTRNRFNRQYYLP
jgi:hypothetical protein